MRHGETEANIQNLLCGGDWDANLTDKGIKQAEDVASTIFSKISDIKTICTTPLIRAQKTAEIINKVLKLPLHIIPELTERSWGNITKQPMELFEKFNQTNPFGAETLKNYDARIKEGLIKALEFDTPVLIVAHSSVWRRIADILSINISEIKIIKCATPYYIECDNKKWSMSEVK